MSKYEVNFKKLALLLVPTFMRKPVIAALAYATVTPINSLHMRFTDFRNTNNYRLTHNGQVCYLRAVLNDYFVPGKRRITITEVADIAHNSVVYGRGGDYSQRIPLREKESGMIVNRRGLSGKNANDFWVNIPYDLHKDIQLSRLKAIINTYKLVSKRYGINYI